MSDTWNCPTCQQPSVTQTCVGCGGKQDQQRGNPLVLFAWMFVVFLIPVYPIVGSLATIALVAVIKTTELMHVPDGFRYFLAAIAAYSTLFLTFKYERSAANSRGYRIFRHAFRVLAAIAVEIRVLTNDDAATPADALFIAVFGVPLAFLALWRIDRVLGAAGPPKPAKVKPLTAALPDAASVAHEADKETATGFWRTLSWRTAGVYGGMLSLFGFILGRDAQLFTVAFLWIAITGGILLVQIIARLFGMSFGLSKSYFMKSAVNERLGRIPGAILYGAVIGAGTGAVLGKLLDGRVQTEVLVIGVILGVPIALVVNRIRARRRRAAASGS